MKRSSHMPISTSTDTMTSTTSLRRSGLIQRTCGTIVLQKNKRPGDAGILAEADQPVQVRRSASTCSPPYQERNCSLR